MKKKLQKNLTRQIEKSFEKNINQFSLSFRPNVLTRDLEARVKVVELVINGQNKMCEEKNVVDISGSNNTDGQGKMLWNLRDVIDPCDRGLDLFCDPYSFVATPISRKPAYITVRKNVSSSLGPTCKKDISFVVYTWDKDGNPAPNVGFYWRCRVVSASLVL